jgi:repressor LexA
MKNEAERYNFIQENSGLSKQDFAKSLGLIKSHGSLIGTGRQKLSRESLQLLSHQYNVNLHWFLTGDGNSGVEPDTVSIRLLDQEAAAEGGKEVEDYPSLSSFLIPHSLIRPHRPEKLLAVYVSGDSMVDEYINDGDIAIFHPLIKEGNGIYVVSVGNTLMVKRVDFDTLNQTVILISANPAYEPRRFSGDDLEDIRIAGRVLASVHRV